MAADSTIFRVAVLQPDLTADRQMANLHMLRGMVDELTAGGLDLLVLPEVFDGNLSMSPTAAEIENARQFLSTLARAANTNVIGGSIFPEIEGRRRNSCFIIDRQGREVGRYDKRIMFSIESDLREPGTGPGIYELDGVRIAVLICADLWWPELAREVCGKADLLCVPAKSSVPGGDQVFYARKLWQNLALTRAMENGLAVLVSDWPEARHDTTRIQPDGARTRHTHYTAGGGSICDPSHRPNMTRIQEVFDKGISGSLATTIHLDALRDYQEYRRKVGLLPETVSESPNPSLSNHESDHVIS
jgi:predicted amidohydrolase